MPNQVECHAGYAYAERPTALIWEDQRLEVIKIIARRRTPQGRYFQVQTQDQRIFEVIYDEAADEWQIHPLQNPGSTRR